MCDTNVSNHQTCPECDYACVGKGQMTRHIKTHSKKRLLPQFNCDECGLTFDSGRKLKNHEKKVHLQVGLKSPVETEPKQISPVRKMVKQNNKDNNEKQEQIVKDNEVKEENKSLKEENVKLKSEIQNLTTEVEIKQEKSEQEIRELKQAKIIQTKQIKKLKDENNELITNRDEWMQHALKYKEKYKETKEKLSIENAESVMEVIEDVLGDIVKDKDQETNEQSMDGSEEGEELFQAFQQQITETPAEKLGRTCEVCEIVCISKKRLEEHIKEEHNNKEQCSPCEKTFVNESTLKSHMKAVHDYEQNDEYFCKSCEGHRTSCDNCIFKSNCNQLKENHIKQKHKLKQKSTNKQCSKCEFKTSKDEELKIHEESHLDMEGVYRCTPCEQIFKKEHEFREHMRSKHVNEEQEEYNCEKCDFVTDCKQLLENHMKQKHREWNCLHCSYQGSNKTNLEKHQEEAQHKEKNFKCHNCKNEFFNKDELMKHRKKDHKVKTCRELPNCTWGDECYYMHPNNTDAMEIVEDSGDSSEPKVECKSCDKSFNSKNEVMQHRKEVHPATVSECRDYKESKCRRTLCWFRHETSKNSLPQQEQVEKATSQQQGFQWSQRAQKPPEMDNQKIMMQMVETLMAMVKSMKN